MKIQQQTSGKHISFGSMTPGTVFGGKVVEVKEIQDTAFGTGEKQYLPNGQPKTYPLLVLEVDGDDELNLLHVKGGVYTSVVSSEDIQKYENFEDLVGGEIKLRYDGKKKRPGAQFSSNAFSVKFTAGAQPIEKAAEPVAEEVPF